MADETLQTGHYKPASHIWREIAIIALMGMEVSWVTPWFRSFSRATYTVSPAAAFGILLGIMAASHLVVRVMDRWHIRMDLRKWITSGLLVISVFIGLRVLLYPGERMGFLESINRPLMSMMDWRSLIPDEFIIILVVLFGWWRGVSLAQEHIEPSSVMGYFRLGILMFLAYVVFNTLITGETPGAFVYLYLFCSLVAMSMARISVLRMLRGGRQNTFNSRWFWGVIGATAGVVLLAGGLAEGLAQHLGWLNMIVVAAIGVLAVVIVAIVSPVIALVISMMNKVQGEAEVLERLTESFEQIQTVLQGLVQRLGEMIGSPDIPALLGRVIPFLRAVLLLGVILAVAIGVIAWVMMRVWKDRRRKQLDEEQESILEGGKLWQVLQGLVRRSWDNLVDSFLNAVDSRRRMKARAAKRIRQIYADLLDLGEEMGCTRLDAQTPLEFLPVIAASLPGLETDLELITSAYLEVRYGEFPESYQAVDAAENAWKRVFAAGRDTVAHREKKSPRTQQQARGN